jgi:hypothetical protein
MKKIIIMGLIITLFCFSFCYGLGRQGLQLDFSCTQHSDCPENAACSSEGECVECVEDDGGREAFVKGILSGATIDGEVFEEVEDYCSSSATLVEYFCNHNGANTYAVENRGYSCGNCEDGRCVECSTDEDCETGNCYDGRCKMRMLAAAIVECSSHSDCPENAACSSEGECVECVEDDGGREAFVKGILSGATIDGEVFEEVEDYCSSSATLVEYFCNHNGANTYAVENMGYSCDYCEDGRCIECLTDADCESGNCNDGTCGIRMLTAEFPEVTEEEEDGDFANVEQVSLGCQELYTACMNAVQACEEQELRLQSVYRITEEDEPERGFWGRTRSWIGRGFR